LSLQGLGTAPVTFIYMTSGWLQITPKSFISHISAHVQFNWIWEEIALHPILNTKWLTEV
jgi:hypothetical protein